MDIRPGQFYSAKEDDDNDYRKHYVKGDLVEVVETDAEQVWYIMPGGDSTHCEHKEFLKLFKFEPEGEKKRQEIIGGLVSEIGNVRIQQKELTSSLSGMEETTTAITTTDSLTQRKMEISLVRAKIENIQMTLKDKQERVVSLVEQQKAALLHKLKPMNEMVERLNEGIYTINLYLGTNQELVQIAKGEAAPKTEKIYIRQSVLYMDEECDWAADAGGVDFEKINTFDEWIKKPKHRQQVIPEKRGIVALRVRRHGKDYGDPWVTARSNKENAKSYFLIRNGDNLYRIYIDIDVGETLFPTQGEFDELMEEVRFKDHRWNRDEAPEMKPGTKLYADAMKAASSKNRHYMRILLILQGLFDRTPVFEPYDGPVNVMERREQNDVFQFINDAEMILPDGRIRYDDWIEDINSRLAVGHRIMGKFPYGDMERRITPRGAYRPEDEVLYTLEERDQNGFAFLYKHSDRSERRARCVIYPDDEYIINFDEAKVEDMEFYINSRIDRPNYMKMIPLLRRAINLKKQEKETEAPFRKLLAGQLLKAVPGKKMSELEAVVDELVLWYKFKNKTHRALNEDDSKALRMIVTEAELRQRKDAERLKMKEEFLLTTAQIIKLCPEAVYIGHKVGKEFVALVPHNDENVFLKEITLREKSGVVVVEKSREWTLLDKRFLRWGELFAAPRWKGWPTELRIADHLTDPERKMAIEMAWEKLKTRGCDQCFAKGRKKSFRPLAVVLPNTMGKIEAYAQTFAPQIPAENRYITGELKNASYAYTSISWVRGPNNELKIYVDDTRENTIGDHFRREKVDDPIKYPWIYDYHGNKYGRLLWESKENIQAFVDDIINFRKADTRASEARDKTWQWLDPFKEFFREQELAKLKIEFLKDNHPALWAEHAKKAKIEVQYDAYGVDHVIDCVVETGEDIEGMSFGEAFDKAKRLSARKKDWHPRLNEIPREMKFVRPKQEVTA